MSEEMDKKSGTRPPSVPQKANINESKKNDNGTPKQYQKYGKRKDYNGNKSYQESYSPRKPMPQKTRTLVDKRPRSRGNNAYRQRDDIGEEYRGDFESALYPGTKKVNLNHLLNFSYTDREAYSDRLRWTGNRGKSRRGGRVNYNKEQFLQANCQFIVKDDGDYTVHNIDPDMLVDWNAVQLIKVRSHELPSCPICLEHPRAAKITRCGHIYCWACILHYLTLGEKSWRKCPICYESVHDKDLKSVITQAVDPCKVGEPITMRLMKRQKGTNYALPKALWEKREGVNNMNDHPEKVSFMKLLSASKSDVKNYVLEPERKALQRQLAEAEVSEVPFIESAFQALKEREDEINGKDKIEQEVQRMMDNINPVNTDMKDNDVAIKSPSAGVSFDGSKKVKQYSSAFSDEEDEVEENQPSEVDNTATTPTEPMAASCETPPTSDKLHIPRTGDTDPNFGIEFGSPEDPRLTPPIDAPEDTLPVDEAAEYLELPSSSFNGKKTDLSDDAFYYYQAADGRQIYLHALNARCLVKEYGGLEHSPDLITANIVEIENIFMSEDLRKRLRYLGHLPLTCEFQVVELAIKEPVLSKDSIRCFVEEIDRRRRLRQRKRRDERRRSKQIQDEENKRMGIVPNDSVIVRSQFLSHSTPPSYNRPASPAAKSDDSSQSSVISPVGSPIDLDVAPLSPSTDDGQQSSSLSFAQMLKGGASKTVWPKINKPSDTEEPKTVSKKAGSDDSDPEDKVPVPVFGHSFGDAIQSALEEHAKSKDGGNTMVSLTKLSGKKKKKQQTLLFSTSMARGGN